MTTREDPSGFEQPVGSNGSSLCLACGLCCNGVLHARTVVKPDDVEHVRTLGLTVETVGDHSGFRQPCPLYRAHRCSIYPDRTPTCKAYQCDLLKKRLAGEITFEQALQAVQRAEDLFADVVDHLPRGYSFAQLRREMDEAWDSGRGLVGSPEQRQTNAKLLLAAAKLTGYLHKHFGKPKESHER